MLLVSIVTHYHGSEWYLWRGGGGELIDSSPFLVYHSQKMGFLGLIIEGVRHPILDE